MSFFGGGGHRRPPPVIKKVIVRVPVKSAPKPPLPTASPQISAGAHRKAATPRKDEPKERVKKLALKRKSHTPSPAMSSGEDTDGEESARSLTPNKRARPNAGPVDPDRSIVDGKNRSAKDHGRFAFIHGADLVTDETGKKYLSAFDDQHEPITIELQYPSESQNERFTLVYNNTKTAKNTNVDYQPLDDIRESIKYICQHYLSPDKADQCSDNETGLEARLNRALNHSKAEDYKAVIKEYNEIISAAVKDGTVRNVLEPKHNLGDLNWVQRILDQVYARTVSPKVDILREYEGFSDNVYGELKPRLVSEMFTQTKLKSGHVFVDLGSGVGNVVLQAALEVGCESWGIEMMENPCMLAELQRKEFAARARLWGLSVGQVHLLKGDFTKHDKLTEVLKRADVVLVNNQVFNPDLNSKLVSMFLDLKDGCQVVSLKPFKPEGMEMKLSNINDLAHMFVDERKLDYFSDSVSWTDAPGSYHIVTKDLVRSAELQQKVMARNGRRAGR